jgi:competence protein ComEA
MLSRPDLRSFEAVGRRLFAVAVVGFATIVFVSAPRNRSGMGDVRLRVDPNVAPRQVLLALPGLGPARVAAIEAARSSSPFRSLGDLDRRVKGIGPATAASLESHLRFHAP